MSRIYKRNKSPYFWWTTRHNGVRYRKSTKQKQRRNAQIVQTEWDLNVVLGKLDFLGIDTTKKVKISEYFPKYIQFMTSRKSRNATIIARGVLKSLKRYLKEQKIEFLNEITVVSLDGYIEHLSCNPKTKKNHLGVIKRMLDQAIREDLLEKNPAILATLPEIKKDGKVRHRLLEPADLKIIFEGAGGWYLYYMFLYHTGLRAGDVALLTYGNIDRKKKAIVSFVRKSRKIYEFPIADVLLDSIPIDKNSSEHIFPTLYTDNEQLLNFRLKKPRVYMQAILKAAKCEHATLHSFRHTFNNTLRDLGLSIEDRQILLTHSSSQTTKIYTHPNFKLAAEFVNRIPKYD